MKQTILVSINFEQSKGGVSRVAHLINFALKPDLVLSLYGSSSGNKKNELYFDQNQFQFLWFLFRKIIFTKPSLIVFDHVGPASILAIIPNFLLKKVAIFLHDEEAWKPVSKRHELALRKATTILCNSEYTMQRFLLHNPHFSSITKVCLLAGVPQSFLEYDTNRLSAYQHWFSDTLPYIVFVSRLWSSHRYKGHMELLDAMILLSKNHSEFVLRLAIIGNGDDVDAIKSKIKDNNLSERVMLFTAVNDDDLARFYKNAVALVFPSVREGFGFVFLESMYFATPCIGVKEQPAEEIIENNISGLLMENNSPAEIAKSLASLCTQPTHFAEMGKAGQDIFYKKFTNAHFKERLLACIS